MSEADHQKFIFDILDLNQKKYPFLKWIYAIPNGGHRHPAVAAQLKAQGVRRGISDICIPIPSAYGMIPYHGAYIELKDGKARKLTAEQKEFASFVVAQGYDFMIAHDCDLALAFIESYLQIKLSR